MSETIVVAIIGVLGTAIVSVINSFITSSKTIYRIEQLEKKVDKHNNIVERMALAEKDIEVLYEQGKELRDEVDGK